MNLKQIFKKGALPEYYGSIPHTTYVTLATFFIWIFLKLKIKPNTVTIIGMLFRIISLYFYLTFFKMPAIVLFQIALIFDYSDGTLARITKTKSDFGNFLDSLSDLFLKGIFPVVLALGLFFFYKDPFILIIALILFAVNVVREMVHLEQVKQRKNKYFGKREKIKSKYSILSRIFIGIINFNYVFFPFIVLFNLKIILAFYFFNIFIESLRIMFDFYSAISGISRT